MWVTPSASVGTTQSAHCSSNVAHRTLHAAPPMYLWGGKKLPVCSSSVLSPSHINPLGKHCYLEHVISGDGYLKDENQHQDAKDKNELLDITEIREKE